MSFGDASQREEATTAVGAVVSDGAVDNQSATTRRVPRISEESVQRRGWAVAGNRTAKDGVISAEGAVYDRQATAVVGDATTSDVGGAVSIEQRLRNRRNMVGKNSAAGIVRKGGGRGRQGAPVFHCPAFRSGEGAAGDRRGRSGVVKDRARAVIFELAIFDNEIAAIINRGTFEHRIGIDQLQVFDRQGRIRIDSKNPVAGRAADQVSGRITYDI